ncbi:MAG: carboxypeptidase regulatory-like domain-containing protein [Deltaproteobacteria bacterium]|nr:carboxypeptidase regulatory-like domain-containing protein [Deltaproteobacteria bacterium]
MFNQRYGRRPLAALLASFAAIAAVDSAAAQTSQNREASLERAADDVDAAVEEGGVDAGFDFSDAEAERGDSAPVGDGGLAGLQQSADASPDSSVAAQAIETSGAKSPAPPAIERNGQTATETDTPIEASPIKPGYDCAVSVRVVDSESDKGLADAVVIAKSKQTTVFGVTDHSGKQRLALAEGVYSVRAFQDAYYGGQIDGVRVKRGQLTEISFKLNHRA